MTKLSVYDGSVQDLTGILTNIFPRLAILVYERGLKTRKDINTPCLLFLFPSLFIFLFSLYFIFNHFQHYGDISFCLCQKESFTKSISGTFLSNVVQFPRILIPNCKKVFLNKQSICILVQKLKELAYNFCGPPPLPLSIQLYQPSISRHRCNFLLFSLYLYFLNNYIPYPYTQSILVN